MKTNPILLNRIGNNCPSKLSRCAADIWNGNRASAHDYTNELKIALTNNIYSGRGVGEHSPEGYGEVAKLFTIKDFVYLGGESAVFQLDNGDILKISSQKYNEYLEAFHAPEIIRGTVQLPKMYNVFNLLKKIQTNLFYFVIQQQGKLNVSSNDRDDLIKRIRNAGYNLEDIKWNQFAYFNIDNKTEPRLIDLGCITQS